jgi:hypothetical protein
LLSCFSFLPAGELGEGEERLFVLQGVVTEEAWQDFFIFSFFFF